MKPPVDWVEIICWSIYGLILCWFLYTANKEKSND